MHLIYWNQFLYPWFCVLGLCVGSFLNVVIFRLPAGYLLGLPSRSACMNCRRKLFWYENIPLVSFLFLQGRCAGCDCRISFRYPFVELLTAVLFIAIYRFYGFSFGALFYCLFVAGLIAITFIDLDHLIIPDSISLPGIISGLLGSFWVVDLGYLHSVLGVLSGGGVFWLLGWVYEKYTGREGLGFGDVKLLAMIGAFLGPSGALGTMVISSLMGSVFGVILMIAQKKDMKLAIPYGPFLAIGALTFLFWGDFIVLRLYSQ